VALEESPLRRKARFTSPAIYQAGVALVYLALAIAMTWPAARHIGSRYPGHGNDLILFPWQFWRLKRDLLLGENPFYTTLLYYPQGVSLAYSNTPWALFALWLPIQAVVGPVGAYGVLFFVALVGNGYAGYRLFRELLIEDRPAGLSSRWLEVAALLAGVILLARPWILSKDSHFSRMFQMGTPLAALFLLRYYRLGRLRDALGAAFWIAVTGLIAWQQLVMGAFVLGGLILWRLVLRRPEGWGQLLLHTLLIALAAAAVMAPFAAPMFSALQTWEDPSDVLMDSSTDKQTDLVSLVAPPVGHPARPLWVTAYYDRPKNAAFLGYAALALAILGVARHPRRSAAWGLLSAACIVLALGAELEIDQRTYPTVPLPYMVLRNSFLFGMIREPSRWNHTLTLPFSMAAAWGGVALMQALRRPATRAAAVALAGVVIGIEAGSVVLPYNTMEPHTPTWYQTLAEEADSFGILDLPTHDRYYDKWYMYYQITHGKGIVGGHVSRRPSEARAYIDGSEWLAQVTDRDAMTMDPERKHVTRELAYLAEADVRYIVLHREFADPAYIDGWADWLTIAPVADQGELLVYRTDPQCERDYWLRETLAPGIGLFGWSVPEEPLHQGAALPVDLRWASCATPGADDAGADDAGADYSARFILRDADGSADATWLRAPSESVPTSQWWENEVVRGDYRLVLPETLDPGRYALELDLIDAASGDGQGATVPLGQVEVTPLTPQQEDDLLFGGEIALLGHDLTIEGEDVVITLYWQAQVAPTDSYKVFVQALDADGEVAAQHDSIPCQWACPTTMWEPGEVVLDCVRLPKDATVDATLVVGLYGEHTLERLTPAGPDASLAQDGTAAVLARTGLD